MDQKNGNHNFFRFDSFRFCLFIAIDFHDFIELDGYHYRYI